MTPPEPPPEELARREGIILEASYEADGDSDYMLHNLAGKIVSLDQQLAAARYQEEKFLNAYNDAFEQMTKTQQQLAAANAELDQEREGRLKAEAACALMLPICQEAQCISQASSPSTQSIDNLRRVGLASKTNFFKDNPGSALLETLKTQRGLIKEAYDNLEPVRPFLLEGNTWWVLLDKLKAASAAGGSEDVH